MPNRRSRIAPAALLAPFLAPLLALAAPAKQVFLNEVQEALALPAVEATTNLVVLSDGTNTVTFHPGYRRAAINGVTVWLNEPAEPDLTKTLKIGRPDLERLLAPILARPSAAPESDSPSVAPSPAAPSPDSPSVAPESAVSPPDSPSVAPPPDSPSCRRGPSDRALVFLDPGHGGEDCGAISAATGQREKDLVLDIALRIGELLLDAGVRVAYSRTNDTFVSLSDRTALAAKNDATLFVSVHANTTGNTLAQGIETFTLSLAGSDSTSGDTRITKKEWPGNAFDATNSVLGYLVQSAVNTARGEADRGLRHARFQVLRQAPCPAILVECGFLSNGPENTSLESGRYRQRIAAAVARAIFRAVHGEAQDTPPPL